MSPFDFEAEESYTPTEAAMDLVEKMAEEGRGLTHFAILAWGRNVETAWWAHATSAFELLGALEAFKAEVLLACQEDPE